MNSWLKTWWGISYQAAIFAARKATIFFQREKKTKEVDKNDAPRISWQQLTTADKTSWKHWLATWHLLNASSLIHGSSSQDGLSAFALPPLSHSRLLLPSPASQQPSRYLWWRPSKAVRRNTVNAKGVREEWKRVTAHAIKIRQKVRINIINRLRNLSIRHQIKQPSLFKIKEESSAFALHSLSHSRLLLPSPASQQSSRDLADRPSEALWSHAAVNIERVRERQEWKKVTAPEMYTIELFNVKNNKNKSKKKMVEWEEEKINRNSHLATRWAIPTQDIRSNRNLRHNKKAAILVKNQKKKLTKMMSQSFPDRADNHSWQHWWARAHLPVPSSWIYGSSSQDGLSPFVLPCFPSPGLLLPSPASQQSSRDRSDRPREAVCRHPVNAERVRDENEKKVTTPRDQKKKR